MQLYKLTSQMMELNKLAEVDPEMEIAVADTLEGIEAEFQDKAQAIATIFLNLDPDVEGIDKAIKQLQERKKLYQNQKARLIEYLRTNMDAAGIKKIDCPLFSITCAKGRESVIVDDTEQIPDDYVVIPEVQARADKTKIMEAHRKGEAVPGTHIERGQSSIRIK